MKNQQSLSYFDESLSAVLAKSRLFEGVSSDKSAVLLGHLGASVRSHDDGTLLVRLGDVVTRMGIVVEGVVEVGFYDEAGDLATVNRLEAGDMIAEAIAYAGEPSIVQATAVGDCRVLWMEAAKLLSPTVLAESPEASLVAANLVRIISRKNVFLNQKAQILTQRYVRDRIKLFLKDRVHEGKADIPFSRSDLARFLGVNRSALSRELGRLRDEGIVSLESDSIIVLKEDFLW
mgnify:CR=1 FL=1